MEHTSWSAVRARIFKVRVFNYLLEHPEQRFGQAAFNVLHEIAPWVAETLAGDPDLDPFHRNDNMPTFMAYISQHSWAPPEED